MNKKIKTGLVGLGRIGKVHLKSLVYHIPHAEVVAVSDIDASTKQVADDYGIANFYADFKDVVDHPGVEAIVICAPATTRLEQIECAASAGKDIFCEKPLDMTVENIEVIQGIVKKYGVKLQVGFNRRFDTDFATLKRKVEDGDIGDPHILRITSRDPGPPPISYIKTSGGLFLDMTIHDFDIARFMVGSEVTEVFALGAVRIDEEIGKAGDIDTAIIQLKFENGTIGAIDNSRKSVYGYDQRVEVFGSRGMSATTNHHRDSLVNYDKHGRKASPVVDFFIERYTEAYINEMRAFFDAISNDDPVPVGAFDALMATKMAMAAQKSLEENRPVKLEEIG